jgi:hypothetical protein
MNNGTKNRNRPTHELRLGSIRASIWDNSNGENQRFNVTLSRIYKDRENNQWKHTDSFGRDDLLPLAKLADQAHSWIWDQRTQNNTQE